MEAQVQAAAAAQALADAKAQAKTNAAAQANADAAAKVIATSASVVCKLAKAAADAQAKAQAAAVAQAKEEKAAADAQARARAAGAQTLTPTAAASATASAAAAADDVVPLLVPLVAERFEGIDWTWPHLPSFWKFLNDKHWLDNDPARFPERWRKTVHSVVEACDVVHVADIVHLIGWAGLQCSTEILHALRRLAGISMLDVVHATRVDGFVNTLRRVVLDHLWLMCVEANGYSLTMPNAARRRTATQRKGAFHRTRSSDGHQVFVLHYVSRGGAEARALPLARTSTRGATSTLASGTDVDAFALRCATTPVTRSFAHVAVPSPTREFLSGAHLPSTFCFQFNWHKRTSEQDGDLVIRDGTRFLVPERPTQFTINHLGTGVHGFHNLRQLGRMASEGHVSSDTVGCARTRSDTLGMSSDTVGYPRLSEVCLRTPNIT